MPVPKLNECNGLIFTARSTFVLANQAKSTTVDNIYLKHVHDEYVENV